MPPSTSVLRTAALLRVGVIAVGLTWAVSLAEPARADRAVSGGGHVIRWDAGLDRQGARAQSMLPAVRHAVAEKLGFGLKGGRAEIVLISGWDRMREVTRLGVPEWAAGVCVGARSLIVVRTDLLDATGARRTLASVLRHEWVHLSWNRRAGPRSRSLPLWVEEGLAEQIGGGLSVDGGASLERAAAFGDLIPFEGLRANWPSKGEEAALAYRQGRSWIRYFTKKNGWDPLRNVLADLADGRGVGAGSAAAPPFEELIFRHSGAPLSQWIVQWRTDLEESADPWFHLLLRDFTGTIFILVALIGGVSFFVLRRRRKRQIAELPDDPLPG